MSSHVLALALAGLLVSAVTPKSSSLAHPSRYKSNNDTLERSQNSRIVNGEPAKSGDVRWQVAILVKATSTNDLDVCGGSAVAPNWVLTAAHCVAGVSREQVEVRSGSVRLDDTLAQRSVPRRILIHKDWNSVTYDNDVALLEADLASSVQAVPMIEGDSDVQSTDHMQISGFGRVSEFGATSNTLLLAYVSFISYDSCNDRQAYNGQVHVGTMFCADAPFGDAETSDSCKGDSGGPITREHKGKIEQVGIISWGNGCGDPSFPGVYVRLSQYRSWIDLQIHSRA